MPQYTRKAKIVILTITNILLHRCLRNQRSQALHQVDIISQTYCNPPGIHCRATSSKRFNCSKVFVNLHLLIIYFYHYLVEAGIP